MRIAPLLGLSALSLLVSAPLVAAAVDPGQAVASRHANFKQLAKTFKALGDEVKGGSPDRAVVKAHAATISATAQRIPSWFPAGTGMGSGPKTGAKPVIWQRPDEFRGKARGLQAEAATLASLAATGSPEAIAAEVKAVGGRCKACHEVFRAEHHH